MGQCNIQIYDLRLFIGTIAGGFPLVLEHRNEIIFRKLMAFGNHCDCNRQHY